MIKNLRSIGPLLIAIFMLMSGSGFLATLISLRLQAAGEPALTVGVVATAYFVGLTVGSVLAFSALVNHVPGKVSEARSAVDRLVEKLAAQISIQNIKTPKMPKLEILS